MGSETTAAAHEGIENSRIFEIRRNIEDEVGENRGAARAVKKHHFVQPSRALEQVLIDLTSPFRLRLVAEDRVEFQVKACAAAGAEVFDVTNQPGRSVELRPRPRLDV